MKNLISDNYDESIGKIIKHYRIKNHYTQTELGNKIGVTKRAISYYEKGERSISLTTAKQLCYIFGITIDDFVKEVDNM